MRRVRSARRTRGAFIVEAAMGWGVLMVIAVLMLKGSINVTSGQQWTVIQAVTDAFMTQETALGNRWPFDDLKDGSSPWPTYPTMTTSSVTIGRLPGGIPITATLKRTKQPDPDNLPAAGGTGDGTTNPALMEAWQLQSFLVYEVADREYVKSRTTLRIR